MTLGQLVNQARTNIIERTGYGNVDLGACLRGWVAVPYTSYLDEDATVFGKAKVADNANIFGPALTYTATLPYREMLDMGNCGENKLKQL